MDRLTFSASTINKHDTWNCGIEKREGGLSLVPRPRGLGTRLRWATLVWSGPMTSPVDVPVTSPYVTAERYFSGGRLCVLIGDGDGFSEPRTRIKA